jgi:hypothetical protein
MTDFNLGLLDSLDTADLEVCHPATGQPTGWVITFAGPGHPQTVAFNERQLRKRMREEREKEQAKTNNRKWKGEDKSTEDVRAENLAALVDRIVGWTPVSINGQDIPFSREMAMQLFGDPRKGWLFSQALDFLVADDSFMPPLPTTS